MQQLNTGQQNAQRQETFSSATAPSNLNTAPQNTHLTPAVEQVAPQANTQTKSVWVQYFDQHGRPYYYDPINKTTAWEKPADVQIALPPKPTDAQKQQLAHIQAVQLQQQDQTILRAQYSDTYTMSRQEGQDPGTIGLNAEEKLKKIADNAARMRQKYKLDGFDENPNPNIGMGAAQSVAQAGEAQGPTGQPMEWRDGQMRPKIKKYVPRSEAPWQPEMVGGGKQGKRDPRMVFAASTPGSLDAAAERDWKTNSKIVSCEVLIDKEKGAGIRFIYDTKGWWIYELKQEPGQPEMEFKDLIVAVGGQRGPMQRLEDTHKLTEKTPDEQVVLMKEHFKDGGFVEVRRGLQLPHGHMDANGKFIWSVPGQPNMVMIPGLGMRPVFRYIKISNMNKKTTWVELRNFLMEWGETYRTQILREKVGTGKHKKNSQPRGEAIVEMQTFEQVLQILIEAQGKVLHDHELHLDVSCGQDKYTGQIVGIAPSKFSGGWQKRSVTSKNGRFGNAGNDLELNFNCDREKVLMHEDVAEEIIKKLRTNPGLPILTQHWVGKHLHKVFGCGQLRKLVFMEPLDYYNSRHEFEAVGDPTNLNDKGVMHAYKIRLMPEYAQNMYIEWNSTRREYRKVAGHPDLRPGGRDYKRWRSGAYSRESQRPKGNDEGLFPGMRGPKEPQGATKGVGQEGQGMFGSADRYGGVLDKMVEEASKRPSATGSGRDKARKMFGLKAMPKDVRLQQGQGRGMGMPNRGGARHPAHEYQGRNNNVVTDLS